jgi:hypothetical protein
MISRIILAGYLLFAASTTTVTARRLGTVSTVTNTTTSLDRVLCRMTQVHTMYVDRSSLHEMGCIVIANGRETDTIVPVRLPDVVSGSTYVMIQGATVVGSKLVRTGDFLAYVVMDNNAELATYLSRETRNLLDVVHVAPMGKKTMRVVRVTSADGVGPKPSLSQIEAVIFNNAVSVASQFRDCSLGQFTLQNAGGIEVTLPLPLGNYPSGAELLTAAQEAARTKMGVSSVGDLADHVLFCQPTPAQSWIGNAATNYWYVNIDSQWCTSLSVILHETGHNLGLMHSGLNGDEYGDKSGYMGYSDSQSDLPRKCYNAAGHWQLEWYKSYMRTIASVSDVPSSSIELAAFVDAGVAGGRPLILQIGTDFFLQYNRAKSFNSGTEAKQDQVTVTQNRGVQCTWSLAGLSPGNQWTASNFAGSGQNLVVEVCSRMDATSSGQPDVMVLSIGLGSANCGRTNPVAYSPGGKTTAATSTAYQAPTASYVAPTASYVAPTASYVAPTASYVAPTASYVAPTASYTAPTASYQPPLQISIGQATLAQTYFGGTSLNAKTQQKQYNNNGH